MTDRLFNDSLDVFRLHTSVPYPFTGQRTHKGLLGALRCRIALMNHRLMTHCVLRICASLLPFEWVYLVVWRDVDDDVASPFVAANVRYHAYIYGVLVLVVYVDCVGAELWVGCKGDGGGFRVVLRVFDKFGSDLISKGVSFVNVL